MGVCKRKLIVGYERESSNEGMRMGEHSSKSESRRPIHILQNNIIELPEDVLVPCAPCSSSEVRAPPTLQRVHLLNEAILDVGDVSMHVHSTMNSNVHKLERNVAVGDGALAHQLVELGLDEEPGPSLCEPLFANNVDSVERFRRVGEPLEAGAEVEGRDSANVVGRSGFLHVPDGCANRERRVANEVDILVGVLQLADDVPLGEVQCKRQHVEWCRLDGDEELLGHHAADLTGRAYREEGDARVRAGAGEHDSVVHDVRTESLSDLLVDFDVSSRGRLVNGVDTEEGTAERRGEGTEDIESRAPQQVTHTQSCGLEHRDDRVLSVVLCEEVAEGEEQIRGDVIGGGEVEETGQIHGLEGGDGGEEVLQCAQNIGNECGRGEVDRVARREISPGGRVAWVHPGSCGDLEAFKEGADGGAINVDLDTNIEVLVGDGIMVRRDVTTLHTAAGKYRVSR